MVIRVYVTSEYTETQRHRIRETQAQIQKVREATERNKYKDAEEKTNKKLQIFSYREVYQTNGVGT